MTMALEPNIPVKPTGNVAELLRGMSRTGFQGRKLGESVEIWKRMIGDPECTIFLARANQIRTLSESAAIEAELRA